MELERKETQNICEICGGVKVVHVTVGWKDYSFHCPKCRHDKFLQGIKNVNLTEEMAMSLISTLGRPGE